MCCVLCLKRVYGDLGTFHGMDVMGIENKMTEDEGDEMLQKQLMMSRASVRIGVPLKRTSLKDEAMIVYDKFLRPEAEMWVCVEQSIANRVHEQIESASEEDGELPGTRLIMLWLRSELTRVMRDRHPRDLP